MEIKNGRFTINSDSMGNIWITETIEAEKSGKPFHKNYGYHRSVKDCLKAFHRYRTLGADAKTTDEVLKAISDAFDDAQQAIESLADSFEDSLTEQKVGTKE